MLILSSIREAVLKSFVFEGRAERLEQWAFLFFTAWVATMLLVLFQRTQIPFQWPYNLVILLLMMWLCVANLSLMVRRLHDHGRSGFMLLWFLVPFLGQVFVWFHEHTLFSLLPPFELQIFSLVTRAVFWFLCMTFATFIIRPGDLQDNRFGDPP